MNFTPLFRIRSRRLEISASEEKAFFGTQCAMRACGKIKKPSRTSLISIRFFHSRTPEAPSVESSTFCSSNRQTIFLFAFGDFLGSSKGLLFCIDVFYCYGHFLANVRGERRG